MTGRAAGRPVDERRREELLDAVVEYAIEHGFAELSWRPIAGALGVAPTSLVHRFGTKEGMLQAIQARLRQRIVTAVDEAVGPEPELADVARAVWLRTSAPQREAEFRLFFAVYGQALQSTDTFADFLEHVVADWKSALVRAQPTADRAVAERRATLVIATLRGLLLDLLTTADRPRIDAAADLFLSTLRQV